MNKFEQMPQGEEMPMIETRFDASYETMMAELDANGDKALCECIVTLPSHEKKKLELLLNQNGRDWQYLARLGKANSENVIGRITAWEDSVRLSADAQAERKASKMLIDFLEDVE